MLTLRKILIIILIFIIFNEVFGSNLKEDFFTNSNEIFSPINHKIKVINRTDKDGYFYNPMLSDKYLDLINCDFGVFINFISSISSMLKIDSSPKFK